MQLLRKLGRMQRAVFLAGVALLAAWMLLHARMLVGTQNGFIRFFLTLVLAVAILLRRKRPRAYGDGGPSGIVARKPLCPEPAVPAVAVLGALGGSRASCSRSARWNGWDCCA